MILFRQRYAHIVRLVGEAQQSKAPVGRIADPLAVWLKSSSGRMFDRHQKRASATRVISRTSDGRTVMSVGPLLDGAPQQANIWIDEVDRAARCPDKQHAYRLLRATLHTLRDWVNADQAADLAAQLPVLIRGVYYEGWDPSSTPKHPHGKEDFIAAVQSNFARDPLRNPELEIGAVFSVLNKHVAPGQLEQMRNALQKPLRALWPEPLAGD